MKLSDQAMTAIMMALQNSIMNNEDVTDTLRGFDFMANYGELYVDNPPIVKAPIPGF